MLFLRLSPGYRPLDVFQGDVLFQLSKRWRPPPLASVMIGAKTLPPIVHRLPKPPPYFSILFFPYVNAQWVLAFHSQLMKPQACIFTSLPFHCRHSRRCRVFDFKGPVGSPPSKVFSQRRLRVFAWGAPHPLDEVGFLRNPL